jgi:hypothetical protein
VEPVRVVLIGGVNRSGTSLVRRILGSHSELAIPPTELGLIRGRRTLPEPRDRTSFLRLVVDVLQWPKVREWRLDDAAVLRAAEHADPSVRGLFLLLLDEYRRQQGKLVAGEKTTGYERALRLLDRWLGDDYTFVQLVRDPLATYASASWYSGAEQRHDPLLCAAGGAASAATGIRMAARRPERYLLVRYEDVVADPEVFVRRACAQIGLQPEPERMLAMVDFGEKENSSFASLRSQTTFDGLIRKSDDLDRLRLVPPEARPLLAAVCGRVAATLGYDLGVSPRVAARARIWLQHAMRTAREAVADGSQRVRSLSA